VTASTPDSRSKPRRAGPRPAARDPLSQPRAEGDEAPAERAPIEHRAAQRIAWPLEDTRIDADALKVVRRLTRHGFEAYLVGGGIRDLLVGLRPKDFDVATSARPEQVRSLFRNSRVIGRRFRLVHVLFGAGKVIEVATFRRSPNGGLADADGADGDDLLIRSDNAFGDAHEDAERRDLTINALFYDVDRKQILDFVGGVSDVRERVVRTIGEPVVRFREDPVRMIRAIKFAARLDLGIAPEVYDAIVLCREAIAAAARPRLFEELLKVLRSGAARRSVWLMWETGLLHVLLPELAALLDDDPSELGQAARVWAALGELDRRTRERGGPLDDLVLLTVLLLEPVSEAAAGAPDRVTAAREFAAPVLQRLATPRRISDGICRLVAVLPRLRAGRRARAGRADLVAAANEIASIDLAVESRPGPRQPDAPGAA
jgi:poly(A) polymerase